MALISMSNVPAVPSPQIPIVSIVALALAVGHTSGCSLLQHTAPWSVHPPVKSDHLFVYSDQGMKMLWKPGVSLISKPAL